MILVVDDDELFLTAMDRLFGGLTLPARSISDGVFIATTQRPDAILLDKNFDGSRRNGFDAIRTFQRASRHSEIVMASAHYSAEDVMKAEALGVYGYVDKVDPAKILRAVNGAVGKARAEEAMRAIAVEEARRAERRARLEQSIRRVAKTLRLPTRLPPRSKAPTATSRQGAPAERVARSKAH